MQPNGVGFSPIASYACCTGEIAGVTVEYHGAQLCGMYLAYGPDYDVHHSVVLDKGTEGCPTNLLPSYAKGL